jgi:Domain of unknown function (DUF4383)
MAHLPINHRLGGFYRFLSGVAGLYVLLFGIVGAAKTWGDPLFERGDTTALGLRTNLAFSLLSIVVGALVVVGAFVGRNVDHFVNYFGGMVFWVSGLFNLAFMRTDANLLNFNVSTCVVSFILGTTLMLSGLYGKRGTTEQAQEEDAFRHSGRGAVRELATPAHHMSAHPGVAHERNSAT